MTDDTQPRSSRWNNFWDKTSSVLIGGLIAGVFSIVGSYFAVTFQMSAQDKAQKVQDQRKVFARIIGRKLVTQQLVVSRLEARVFSDYHEEVWKRIGSPKDSLDLSEAQRWMRKSEDLAFEIAKNNQALFEDIAIVQALFPNTQQLRDLCAPIYKFHTLTLKKEAPHTGPVEEVKQWKDTAVQELSPLAESEYGRPVDALVEFLQPQLPQ